MKKRPNSADLFRVSIEGPAVWLWYVGAIRVGVLLFMALGAYILMDDASSFRLGLLSGFYLFGFISCCWYLASLVRGPLVKATLLTWAQMLVDFCVVAATISFTGGSNSFATFLFVVVVLEASLLLSPAQGFVFASLATVFMAIQVMTSSPLGGHVVGWDAWQIEAIPDMAYKFAVQGLAYYLTAAISGYWNQRVRRLNQFQREILDNMNNGFIITNAEGAVMVLNKAACRILALEEGGGVGLPVQEVLRTAASGECPVLTSIRTRRDYTRYEFEAIIGEDDVRLLGLSTSCMYDSKGILNGSIVAFSDLTELAIMRDELKRQDCLAAVGELSTGLAHEIRNPVAAIRGAIEELERSMEEPVLARRLTSIAMRECDQLNYIVSEFLDFAREPRMERHPFDLWELLDEVAGLLQRSVNGNGLHMELKHGAEHCPISGDRAQLKQVFINIGKNAVEAMNENGTLTISASRDQVSVAVVFEDEGPGIPPDEVARIFEPFYTTKESGVGMGLAVCMRIISAHDGTIHVTSRREHGASLIVRLPAARFGE